jgi:hypothetical protein
MKPFPKTDRSGRFITLASGNANDNDALPIRADARVLGATVKKGETFVHTLDGAHAYLVPASGAVEINGQRVEARDGAAIEGEKELSIRALEDSELVLVETKE